MRQFCRAAGCLLPPPRFSAKTDPPPRERGRIGGLSYSWLLHRHRTLPVSDVFQNIRRIVKLSAVFFQNALHKEFSIANICAGGCSFSARIFRCIHQSIGQYPDASGKIPVTNRWCSRLSRAARVGTAAESRILRPAPPLPPRSAQTLCPCPA